MERVKVLTYIISSLSAALVGLIIAAQLEAAHPATGESFELTAIAARRYSSMRCDVSTAAPLASSSKRE